LPADADCYCASFSEKPSTDSASLDYLPLGELVVLQ
jgi:hypothetical protein